MRGHGLACCAASLGSCSAGGNGVSSVQGHPDLGVLGKGSSARMGLCLGVFSGTYPGTWVRMGWRTTPGDDWSGTGNTIQRSWLCPPEMSDEPETQRAVPPWSRPNSGAAARSAGSCPK